MNTQKSQNKMVLRSKAHSAGFIYKIWAGVLIKKDFDTNLETKNRGLDTNNGPGIVTIIEVEENSLVVQKDKSDLFEVSIRPSASSPWASCLNLTCYFLKQISFV